MYDATNYTIQNSIMEDCTENIARKVKHQQEHSDIGPSAYFAKLGKKKVNEEKEIEKHSRLMMSIIW